MSSPIVIPFNFQPVQTSKKTTNYTIPAGRYARATAIDCRGQLNGVEIFIGNFVTITTGNGRGLVGMNFTGKIEQANTTGSRTVSYVLTNGGSTSGVTITNASNANNLPVTYFENGFCINIPNSNLIATSGVTPTIEVISSTSGAAFRVSKGIISPASIWVKSGDVLAGTSWIVEEYNQIS